MLKKVVYVALLVSDQDKALDFYTRSSASRSGVTARHPPDSIPDRRRHGAGLRPRSVSSTPGKAELGSAVYTIE